MANRNNKKLRAFVAPLVAAGMLVGCVSAPQLPYASSEAPIVSLPLAAAGVADGRNVFARNFAAELASSALYGAKEPAKWTHWPPALPSLYSAPPLRGVSVLVVPGIFGDCVADQSLPFSDGVTRTATANLKEGYAYLAPSGLQHVRAINVRGRASSEANGAVIAAAIRRESEDPAVARIIVVGYSKGVPDTLHALERLGASGLPQQPLSFVSLSGVVMGTPIADTHEVLYKRLATRFDGLQCSPSDGQEVTSLTRRERRRWLASHPRFPGISLYTVVAHTNAKSISPGLIPFYRRLAKADLRNDGQVLASDAVLPGSTLLAEVNSDHWTYVLPLRDHPNWLVRSAAADHRYPRAEFFRALVRTVVELETTREGAK